MVEVTVEYSDKVKLEAIKQMMFDIKDLAERTLGIKTTLYYREPEYVEWIMTSAAYYYLLELKEITEEYKPWIFFGRKQTRIVTSNGSKIFGFGFGSRTTVRFEIFQSEMRESITKIAKSFAEKFGFSNLLIELKNSD